MRSIAIVLLSILSLNGSLTAQAFPEVVSELDLNRYFGRWYEVASTKPFFQEGCVCVTADYSLKDDGNVEVVNTCRKDSVTAPAQPTLGVAQPTDDPAKFKVSFGNIPTFFSNYWVVALAEDYSWAVVSSRFRNPVWILSRTPELAPELIEEIKSELAMRNFNVSEISETVQKECWSS